MAYVIGACYPSAYFLLPADMDKRLPFLLPHQLRPLDSGICNNILRLYFLCVVCIELSLQSKQVSVPQSGSSVLRELPASPMGSSCLLIQQVIICIFLIQYIHQLWLFNTEVVQAKEERKLKIRLKSRMKLVHTRHSMSCSQLD